jgi:hypothetical protein
MVRFPMFGFSRRVEDTVARAMAILKTREDRPYVQTALGPPFNTGGQAHKGSLLASGMTICSQKSAHRKFAAENETRSQGRLGPSARASFPLWRQWGEVGMIRNAPGTRIMKPPR